jgi:hypothetical protein
MEVELGCRSHLNASAAQHTAAFVGKVLAGPQSAVDTVVGEPLLWSIRLAVYRPFESILSQPATMSSRLRTVSRCCNNG